MRYKYIVEGYGPPWHLVTDGADPTKSRVFCAPRPLCGTEMWKNSDLGMPGGPFFARVDNHDRDAALWVRRNQESAALELKYITRAEVEAYRADISLRFGIDATSSPYESVVQSYLNWLDHIPHDEQEQRREHFHA